MDEGKTKRGRERLQKLADIMRGKRAMLIVLQDFPDPDAMASAAALKELARVMAGLQVSVACSGVVGRSENRALVKYMDINLLNLQTVDFRQYDVIAMLDTQPQTGNNALPQDIRPNIVIDHHPIVSNTRKSDYHDIRKQYGATSTMLYEYLKAAGITVSTQLATALVYGIRSDTDDLGREISQNDVAAFVDLYPSVNHRIMGRIQRASLPAEYYGMLHDALVAARKYGRAIAANLGAIENPDMIGEVADLLLRGDDCQWAFCTGSYGGRLLLSVRTENPENNAGHLVRKIVWHKGTGGGHGAMAGGQVVIDGMKQGELQRIERLLLKRFLKNTGNEGERGVKLIKASS